MDPQPPPWRILEIAPGDPSNVPSPASRDAVAAAAPRRGAIPSLSVLAALVAAAVLGVAAVVIASSGGGTTVDARAPAVSDEATSSGDTFGLIVIDVAGAVVRPGVYHLPASSRVGDAIAAAGGFAPRVDAARVAAELNLAAIVRDGDRVIVASRDDTPASAGPGAKAGPIDLNHATAEQLDSLPGIGPVTAAKIVASRTDQPFRAVDELRSRGLVGEKTFDKLKTLVTVG